MRKVIRNELDTREFGIELAKKLKPGDVVALIGDLGTGKTTLTKSIAEGLGITEMITSPTLYDCTGIYRGGVFRCIILTSTGFAILKKCTSLAMRNIFSGRGVSVVEWADQIMDIIPEDAIIIRIEYGTNEDERIYDIENLNR